MFEINYKVGIRTWREQWNSRLQMKDRLGATLTEQFQTERWTVWLLIIISNYHTCDL